MTEEQKAEIVSAVESADLANPEIVCDFVLDIAERGGDWRAELAKASSATVAK